MSPAFDSSLTLNNQAKETLSAVEMNLRQGLVKAEQGLTSAKQTHSDANDVVNAIEM